MNNEKNTSNSKRPHGPGMQMEKPKDFKNSITKLFKSLKLYKIFIIIALILAISGSILSLIAPNKLSKLTDEIQKGIVLNTTNLKKLTTDIEQELKSEELKNKLNEIIDIKIDEETINTIMSSKEISYEEKQIFQKALIDINNNKDSTINIILQLPEKIQNIILKDTTYKNQTITSNDKKQLLLTMQTTDNKTLSKLPDSIKNILLEDSKIDNEIITSKDKFIFIEKFNNIDSKNVKNIYSKVDQLPKSIQNILIPSMNMNKIKKITITLASLYILSAIFTFIQSILMTDVANKFAKKLRSNISEKINKLPLKYFDRNLSGDILSRVTNDVDTIAQSMNQSLASLVSAITLFIGSIIMMFYTNYIMAITAILSSLFGFVFMFKILSKSQKYFTARQVELGKLNGHIEEVYSGLNVVKVYNGKKESNQKFDELNKSVYECNRKSQFLSGLMMPMMNFIGNFGYVAVCIIGALLVSKDMITFGVIVAFITYVRLFTNPLSQIAQGLTSLQTTAAASERVFEFLEEKELTKENTTKTLEKNKVKGNVEFKHVKFGYDKDKIIIKDFNAKIKPGQKIAIVGPTGAGKTTIVNLLMRFYELNSGDITIDNISTKDLSRENIHDLFTMVLQDTWLFNGTIKENIIYNNKNITDKEVIDVCKKVGVHHFIKTLPHGYDSVISDIDSISSGQKQLLTIARGMIDNKPLLILDEATSNVDTRTEELVQQAMDKLSEGKTSFIIAHRLSTIKNADLILVMKEGNIIEQGSHDELIKKNGFYANLYNSQFDNLN